MQPIRRRHRAAVQDPPQRPRHGPLPAHRPRAVPQAAGGGGFERVYEISRVFRNEGVSTATTPSSRSSSSTRPTDYTDLMELTETLFAELAQSPLGTRTLTWASTPSISRRRGGGCRSSRGCRRRSAHGHARDRRRHAGARAAAGRGLTDAEGAADTIWKHVFDELVEPALVQPTFVTDFPIGSPLAKRKRDNPRLVDRFEGYVGCRELVNAYSELNDPIDQLARFREQAALLARGDQEAHWLGRGLRTRTRVRDATDGGRRGRYRPPRHALRRPALDPRGHPVSPPAPGGAGFVRGGCRTSRSSACATSAPRASA